MDQDEINHMAEITGRITKLEDKVDVLLAMFERTTGAWMLLKWLGSLIVGLAAVWAFITDHLKFH